MRTSIIYHLIIQTIKPLLKAWGLKKSAKLLQTLKRPVF